MKALTALGPVLTRESLRNGMTGATKCFIETPPSTHYGEVQQLVQSSARDGGMKSGSSATARSRQHDVGLSCEAELRMADNGSDLRELGAARHYQTLNALDTSTADLQLPGLGLIRLWLIARVESQT